MTDGCVPVICAQDKNTPRYIKTEDGCLLSVPLYFQIEDTLFPYNPTFKMMVVLLILDLGDIFREPYLCKIEVSKELFGKAILLLEADSISTK